MTVAQDSTGLVEGCCFSFMYELASSKIGLGLLCKDPQDTKMKQVRSGNVVEGGLVVIVRLLTRNKALMPAVRLPP